MIDRTFMGDLRAEKERKDVQKSFIEKTKADIRSDFQRFPENLDYRTIVRRRSVFKKKHRILFARNPTANEKNTR